MGQVDNILGVKEPWNFTNLLKISVAESLLDNHIDQVLADSVVLVLKLAIQLHNALSRLLDQNCVLSPRYADIEHYIFFELR